LATIPATIDEAVHWITRLLAHFPRRDVAKDAVVVADLASDMIDAGVSIIAIKTTCDEIRKNATAKSPFMPPSGEILTMAKQRTETYRRYKYTLENPPVQIEAVKRASMVPWEGKRWDEMSYEVRKELWGFLTHTLRKDGRLTYCRTTGLNFAEIEAWAEEDEENCRNRALSENEDIK